MGNTQDRSFIGTQPYAAPFLKTPVSDFLLRIVNFQQRKDCAMYELHYVDCMEAYGHHIGLKKCRLIYHDLHECVFQTKRLRRSAIMKMERRRQYKNGEREKEYPDVYPAFDLF